jgi:hypothetical protein
MYTVYFITNKKSKLNAYWSDQSSHYFSFGSSYSSSMPSSTPKVTRRISPTVNIKPCTSHTYKTCFCDFVDSTDIQTKYLARWQKCSSGNPITHFRYYIDWCHMYWVNCDKNRPLRSWNIWNYSIKLDWWMHWHFFDIRLNCMSGTLPSQIWHLSKLNVFSLCLNKFVGNVPKRVGLMTALTYFDM